MVKKALKSISHEVMEFGAKELSHNFTLSLKENRNNLRWIASELTQFSLKVSQMSRKEARYVFGSFVGSPPNWYCETIWMYAGLILKVLTSMVGFTMQFWLHVRLGTPYSSKALAWALGFFCLFFFSLFGYFCKIFDFWNYSH